MRRTRYTAERVIAALAMAAIGAGVAVSLHRRALSSTSVAAPSSAPREPSLERRSLTPVGDPDPDAAPGPRRVRPYRVVASADGGRAYVTLAGTEAAPGHEVLVVDVVTRAERARIDVGAQPYGLALHPGGRWLLVTNRFSSFVSVIDTTIERVVAEISVPFYCDDLVIAPDGARAYLSNFWKDQVIVVDLVDRGDRLDGSLVDQGLDRVAFAGDDARGVEGLHAIVRGRCGQSTCHLYRSGGFVAGPDRDEAFTSAAVHVFPGDADGSPLLRAVLPARLGGLADATNGYHHPGGAVFHSLDDPDLRALRAWIEASPNAGPGIDVGSKPRDLALAGDGRTLYVANTGSLDVSVVDLTTHREVGRIATRSPVTDVVEVDGWLVLTTHGLGSGHPGSRDPGRESLAVDQPLADRTILRDLATGKPLPMEQQRPAGPFDDVDGTRQEKFRDVGNDVIVVRAGARDAARYAATDELTRYGADSFEALAGDTTGDIPAALRQVVGALPEQIVRRGDRMWITMAGTFEVQEWQLDPTAPPLERLRPRRVLATGLGPSGIALAGDTMVVADHLGDTLTFVELTRDGRATLRLARDAPFPATDRERGELYARSALFSPDLDASCVHCHYRDTSDGRKWSVNAVTGQSATRDERTGGSREVPDMRGLFHDAPMLAVGVLAVAEPLGPMMDQAPLEDFLAPTPAGDFTAIRAEPASAVELGRSAHATYKITGRPLDVAGVTVADLVARRDAFLRQQSERWLGRPWGLRELQRVVAEFQGGEGRLLPNPEDPEDPMVVEGRRLFESAEVGCAGCHPAPTFTDKVHPANPNRSFPPLVTPTTRDAIHRLISPSWIDARAGYTRTWDPVDRGRMQAHLGHFVAPSLRGLWARPPRLLHHGGAITIREVLATPQHPALRSLRFPRLQAERPELRELGKNEQGGVPDTHGATSHLSIWELECLLRYVTSIE